MRTLQCLYSLFREFSLWQLRISNEYSFKSTRTLVLSFSFCFKRRLNLYTLLFSDGCGESASVHAGSNSTAHVHLRRVRGATRDAVRCMACRRLFCEHCAQSLVTGGAPYYTFHLHFRFPFTSLRYQNWIRGFNSDNNRTQSH